MRFAVGAGGERRMLHAVSMVGEWDTNSHPTDLCRIFNPGFGFQSLALSQPVRSLPAKLPRSINHERGEVRTPYGQLLRRIPTLASRGSEGFSSDKRRYRRLCFSM